eukprot:Polyplicarium_translucidae@DN1896_c1_g1_i2.p2
MLEPDAFMRPQDARRLLKSSCLMWLTLLFAAYCRLWDCFAMNAIVIATSINYWRNPRLGRRRILDVVAVWCGLTLHAVLAASQAPRGMKPWWFLAIFCAVAFYLVGRHHGNMGNHDVGIRFHQGLHATGVAANLVLYYGLSLTRGTVAWAANVPALWNDL